MIIKNKKYTEEGLIREAVKCGYGDLRVIVENEEIRTFKYILCVRNETFRKLLSDTLFEEPLKLCDKCSKESFFLLEKYYQGIEIEINKENCVDLLSMCMCYNEESLLKNVVDFIHNHLDEYIMVGLLNRREMLLNNNMRELKSTFEYYLKSKSYRIMKSDLLKYLSCDSLEYLLSVGIKFNGNEIGLKKLLLDYYENINDIEEKDEMKKIIRKCISGIGYEKEKYSIRYYSIPPIKNTFLFDMLMYYYPSEDIQTISFEKHDLLLLQNENISDDIEILLKSNEIKVVMLVLEICDSLNIKIDIKKHIYVLDLLLDHFKIMKNVREKRILLEKIVKYIPEENSINIFKRMKEKNGIEFLFILLKNKNLLNGNINEMLINYFHEFRLNIKEIKLMNMMIEDSTTKIMIIYHKLKNISYQRRRKEFIVGDKVIIVPKIDNLIDVEEITIAPNLACGLSIDKRTGVIYGVPNKEYSNSFIITAKNIWNKVSTAISITILDKIHFDQKTCEGRLDTFRKTLRSNDLFYTYGCLNVKLKNGVYHFILNIESNSFIIGMTNNDCKKFYISKYFKFLCIDGMIIIKKDSINRLYRIELKHKIYEIIFDMNKKTFNIKDKHGIIYTVASDIDEELYPYIRIGNGSCTLLQSWIE